MNINAEEFRKCYHALPFAIRELIIGNVIVENLTWRAAYRLADVLLKKQGA